MITASPKQSYTREHHHIATTAAQSPGSCHAMPAKGSASPRQHRQCCHYHAPAKSGLQGIYHPRGYRYDTLLAALLKDERFERGSKEQEEDTGSAMRSEKAKCEFLPIFEYERMVSGLKTDGCQVF
jgi:hypothetical protein